MKIMQILRQLLLAKRYHESLRLAASIRNCVERSQIEKFQVERFNAIWKDATSNVPFYRAWRQRYSLPNEISSLKDLDDWPILTKADLRQLNDFIREDCPKPSKMLMTGGSTGEPVRLPVWSKGDGGTGSTVWIARAAYGVLPGDKTLMFWGHKHLYGKGLRRFVNSFKRSLKDWVLNYTRISAYDLSLEAMQGAFRVLMKTQPKVIIGFSPAVLAFCRSNAEKKGVVKSVKIVICTAGPLMDNEKKEISEFFGAHVCMEYGSVEGACMAYTRPSDGEYVTMWHTHLLQGLRDCYGYRNIITRFANLYVPIIRYDIGDYLVLDDAQQEENKRSVLHIKTVNGRPSEMVKFKNGVSFFGALVGDCVKQVKGIVSSQIHLDESLNKMTIWVTADRTLTDEDKSLVISRLRGVVEGAENLDVVVLQKDCLTVTVGGKIPRIVRD